MDKKSYVGQLACGCPGTQIREIKIKELLSKNEETEQKSQLTQWPVQLTLLPPFAPFFQNSDLLISADCVPFANANFHSNLLKGKSLVIGCPKLDNIQEYENKLIQIFKNNNLKSITVAIMEVPCCYRLYATVENALKSSGKDIPLEKIIVSVSGDIQ